MQTIHYVPNLPWSEELLLFEDEARTVVADITGVSFRMHWRSRLSSEVIIAEASTNNGKITQTNITDGDLTRIGIKIVLSAIDTLNLYRQGVRGVALTDIEATYPDLSVFVPVLSFRFEPSKPITRDF